MRIGLFGGTFNPVHNGHIQVAREIKDNSGLDTVYFIPAHLPPHKDALNLATASDRWEMLRLALSAQDGMVASAVEMNRDGPSFTIDTIRHFKAHSRPGDELFWIVGVDAFMEIDTWRSYRELIRELQFIIMERPGVFKEAGYPWYLQVGEYLNQHISISYRFNTGASKFVHPAHRCLHISNIHPVDISSTMVRERVKKGLSIQSLVPEAVKDYIDRKGLYR